MHALCLHSIAGMLTPWLYTSHCACRVSQCVCALVWLCRLLVRCLLACCQSWFTPPYWACWEDWLTVSRQHSVSSAAESKQHRFMQTLLLRASSSEKGAQDCAKQAAQRRQLQPSSTQHSSGGWPAHSKKHRLSIASVQRTAHYLFEHTITNTNSGSHCGTENISPVQTVQHPVGPTVKHCHD